MAVTQNEEGGVTLKVELPENLTRFLEQPRCLDIGLPEPGNLTLNLPMGARIKGVADVTQGIPTDCTLNASLLLQLGPYLANLECFIRVLKLLKPLIEVINGLPFPPVKAIKDFGEAAVDVVECITSLTTPAGLGLFIRDILCLIIRILNCLIDQMQSLLAVMGSLSLQFTAAEGNPALQANLACAQDNAQKSANSALQSVEPVMLILEMVGPLMEVAQVGPIEIPSFGDVEGVEQMEQFVDTLGGLVETLELAAEVVGGCD